MARKDHHAKNRTTPTSATPSEPGAQANRIATSKSPTTEQEASAGSSNASASTSPSSQHQNSNSTQANSTSNTAGSNEYFVPGSSVRCVTIQKEVVEGEVMAFDPVTKMIIIKCPASNRRTSLNDVIILNLDMVSDVEITKEAPKDASSVEPPNLNVQVLNSRAKTNIQRRKQQAKAFKPGVSTDGQKVFQSIIKTLDDVDWKDDSIVVWNKVTIVPPYRPENVRGFTESKAFIHVKKIVTKHWNDENEKLGVGDNGSSNPTSPQSSAAQSQAPAQVTNPVAEQNRGSTPGKEPPRKPSPAMTPSQFSSNPSNTSNPPPHFNQSQPYRPPHHQHHDRFNKGPSGSSKGSSPASRSSSRPTSASGTPSGGSNYTKSSPSPVNNNTHFYNSQPGGGRGHRMGFDGGRGRGRGRGGMGGPHPSRPMRPWSSNTPHAGNRRN